MYNSMIMKGIKRSVLIGTAAALCLVGCGCGINKIRVSFDEKASETETETISVQIPEIHGMSKEFCEGLNEEFEDRAETRIKEFLNNAEETAEKRDSKAKLAVTQRVTYNKNGILSILGEGFEYTSGMTGVQTRYAVNIDTKTEQRIYLCDLFNDGEYVDFINAKLEKMCQSDEYSDIWETPKVGEAQNEFFFFSGDGLVIFYPPYELSYYARGFVEFTIPYRDLYGYLKTEYCDLY